MKKLKKFEDIKKFNNRYTGKYKIGDYILLNVEEIENNNKIWGYLDVIYDNFGLITDIQQDDSEIPYIITFYNNEIIFVDEDEIKRLLTNDEKNIFLLKKETYKYNL